MNIRSLAAHVFAGVLLALALALVSLGSSAGHGTAYARQVRIDSGMMGHATVDGIPAPPAGCAVGDSWCAFCVNNPLTQACQAFPAAKAAGQTTRAPASNSGNNPVPGVTSGGLTAGSSIPRASFSFWRQCTTLYGSGVLWTPANLPPPPGAIC